MDILRLRRRLKISQRELALLTGITRVTIINLEHQRRMPSVQTLRTLASIRGMTSREAAVIIKNLKAAMKREKVIKR